ncbi:15352_t:CDS:1, partial [Funneliformis geosporum]
RDDAIAELKAEVVKLRDDNEESKQQPFLQSEIPENKQNTITLVSNICEKEG